MCSVWGLAITRAGARTDASIILRKDAGGDSRTTCIRHPNPKYRDSQVSLQQGAGFRLITLSSRDHERFGDGLINEGRRVPVATGGA